MNVLHQLYQDSKLGPLLEVHTTLEAAKAAGDRWQQLQAGNYFILLPDGKWLKLGLLGGDWKEPDTEEQRKAKLEAFIAKMKEIPDEQLNPELLHKLREMGRGKEEPRLPEDKRGD